MSIFKVEDYKFVTVDKGGLVGSIYFANGRIRLLHDNGPQVSLEAPVKQVVMKHPVVDPAEIPVDLFVRDVTTGGEAVLDLYEQTVRNAAHADSPEMLVYANEAHEAALKLKAMLAKTEKETPAVVGTALLQVAKWMAVGNYLYEELEGGWEHASRGVPARIPFTLNQPQLDQLCTVIDGCTELKAVQNNGLLYDKIGMLEESGDDPGEIAELQKLIDHSVEGKEEEIIKAANQLIGDLCVKLPLLMPLHVEYA